MDPGDIFRRFFGFRTPHGSQDPRDNGRFHDDSAWHDDEDAEQTATDIFGVFAEFEKEMREMQRNMERMFGNESEDFPPVFSFPPALPPPRAHKSPRDEMLKNPNEHSHSEGRGRSDLPIDIFKFSPPAWSQGRKDTDLDQEVKERGVEELLKHRTQQEQSPQSPGENSPFSAMPAPREGWTFSSSITTSTIRDGKRETRRVVQDSHGNEETTVITQEGDKRHVVTTWRDDTGKEERRERIEKVFGGPLDMQIDWGDDKFRRRSPPSPADQVRKDEASLFEKLFGFPFKPER